VGVGGRGEVPVQGVPPYAGGQPRGALGVQHRQQGADVVEEEDMHGLFGSVPDTFDPFLPEKTFQAVSRLAFMKIHPIGLIGRKISCLGNKNTQPRT